MDLDPAKEKLKEIFDWQKDVESGNATWETYFDKLDNGEYYIKNLIKNTKDLSKLEGQDLVDACNNARETIIAHNQELSNMSLKAQAGKAALSALATAGNMIATWLVSKGIELAVIGIDELAHSTEHCKERVNELMSNYQTALDKANSNANAIENLAPRYEELSKGVNNLGQNVSLTTDEYIEYNQIINQIADMFPNLIQGYTDEGNAILSLKGNVEELRGAYKDAQQDAYNMLITTGKNTDGNDIIKQWEDTHDPGFWARLLDLGSDDVGGGISVTDALEQLNAIQQMSAEEYREIVRTTNGSHKEIAKLTDIEKDIGYGTYLYKALGLDSNTTDEEFKNAQRQARALAQTYKAEIESALFDVETLANAYLMTNEDYDALDEESKNAASILVNNLNDKIASGFHSKEDVGAYVDNIVQMISNNSKAQNALIGLFTMDTANMPVGSIQSQVNTYINTLAKLLNEDPIELKARIGFNNSDTQPLITKVKGFLYDQFDSRVEELTLEDLQIAAEQINIPAGTLLSWDELIARIRAIKGLVSDSEHPVTYFPEVYSSPTTNDPKKYEHKESDKNTPEVQTSPEEYTSPFSQIGLPVKSAINEIIDMLSLQEKFSDMANELSQLKPFYDEFINKGFASESSLESLPNTFKKLKGYDLFSEIAGDPTQGKERIQQAFNDIVGEYIISQGTLTELIGASESQIQSYIANLKEMEVANAEEIVNNAFYIFNQENALINAAEEEYVNYLMAKDGYDDEYLKSAISKNSQLASALGEPYQADYNNWCTLLSEKAIAYNKFVNSLQASSNTNLSGEPLSVKGQAEKILKETDNGKKNVYDPFAKPTKMSDFYFKKDKPGKYTKEQVDNARDFLKKYNKSENAKNQLKLDYSTINTNYSNNYPPNFSSNNSTPNVSGSDDSLEDTKDKFEEFFDWIERRVKKFQGLVDKWLKQAETAITGKFIDIYYKKANSSIKNQLSTYSKIHTKYMSNANSTGLDETYAKKVRNGTIDIETINDEELATKIKDYQDWYDKAQDAMDSFRETAEKLYNLPLDKAAKKVDIFSNAIDLMKKKLGNEIKYTEKNKIIDKQTSKEKQTLNAYKTAESDTKKSLKNAREELRKSKNLNKDDGINAKERKKIKKAIKSNKAKNNDEVNLSYFKENSAGYKAAVKYNEALKAYKKAANDATSAQQDYNAWLVEASKLKFDNIADHYDKKVQMSGYDMSSYDNTISEIEASGRKVHKSHYESQRKINLDILSQHLAEKADLEKSLASITKDTDEWYDAYDKIQQVNTAISECRQKTCELNKTINQLHFDIFDDISEGIGRIVSEQEFLQGLFAHEKTTDKKTGTFTDAGLAKLGSLSVIHYAYEDDLQRYSAEIAELKRMLASGSLQSSTLGLTFNSRDEAEEYLENTYDKYRDFKNKLYGIKTEIHSTMEELYQTELDYLSELIGAKKEALNAEKDLHDYQRTISEKTEGIATIRKQIAAYSGDTSQEGMAKLQRLQKELTDREDDLKETEYNRLISDQQDMLDKLYDEYSQKLEEKMENFMVLVQEGLDTANNNMSGIRDYLEKKAKENKYDLEIKGLFEGSKGIEKNVENATSQVVQDKNTQYESTKPKETPPVPTTKKKNDNNKKKNNNKKKSSSKKKKSSISKKNGSSNQEVALEESSFKRIFTERDTLKNLGFSQLESDILFKDYRGQSSPIQAFREQESIIWDPMERTSDIYAAPDTGKPGILPGPMLDAAIQTFNISDVVPDLTATPSINTLSNVVNIDSITLPNVTNYDEFKDRMFHDMQNNGNYIRFVNDASLNRTDGMGRLAKNTQTL